MNLNGYHYALMIVLGVAFFALGGSIKYYICAELVEANNVWACMLLTR